ncbi:hypothetical protein RHGRI_026081 [Rhododendron griersonianum]|uniref:X8 domain-containing protein n=1 Tax=Rhododendron griersonianum TaxID=479676 RepID=A0AAV6IV01_9ERIC|nr:hypothetical protein RHGRI_026080 [Rhododendron griersonianum]KAG5531339.1 hypothetical protein RHGRI_026081 [Rhododendron griersonianum]
MASLFKAVGITAVFLSLMAAQLSYVTVAGASWCVTRSDASSPALQTALDYACGSGADCSPILSSGLCFLPNTIQAHASYAFNSYYQRKANAPGSCNFGGTATVAETDPSYGSCVFPSSSSTAGGTTPGAGGTTPGTGGTPPGTTPRTPSLYAPPPPGTTGPFSGNNGGLTPGLGPVTNTNNSKACLELSMLKVLISLSCSLLVSFVWQFI